MFKTCQRSIGKFFKKQSGQGILEVIVTIAVGTVLILALVVLATRANRSADSSKAASQASALASQTLEIVKSIRARDIPGSLVHYPNAGSWPPGSGHTWNDFMQIDFNDSTGDYGWPVHIHMATADTTHPYYDGPTATDCSVPTLPTGTYCFDLHSYTSVITVDNREYTENIYVADTPEPAGKSKCNTTVGDHISIKQITIVVSWTDQTGDHEAINTTCIQR